MADDQAPADLTAAHVPSPAARWLSAAGIAEALQRALRRLTRKDDDHD